MIEETLSGLIGFLGGFATRVFYDKIEQPNLIIDNDNNHLEYVGVPSDQGIPHVACRIFVYNKKKWFLNSVAKNCIAWVKSASQETKQQINWVGEHDSININIDDYQKVNLFAILSGSDNFSFGTENNLFPLRPPYRHPPFEFLLKITSSNGVGDTVRVNIRSITWSGSGANATPTIDVRLSNDV